MKVLGWIVVVGGMLVCLTAIAFSFYPGHLVDILTFTIILTLLLSPFLALFLIILLALLVWVVKTGRYKSPKLPWRQIGLVLLMLFGTYVLIKFYIPRRIAFALHRPKFQQLVTDPPFRDRYVELNEWLGIYHVDEYATDSRGGQFFRVYRGFAGFGPEVMSYGFCFNANLEGTPFGNAYYRTHRLGNGWEWFRASDDW